MAQSTYPIRTDTLRVYSGSATGPTLKLESSTSPLYNWYLYTNGSSVSRLGGIVKLPYAPAGNAATDSVLVRSAIDSTIRAVAFPSATIPGLQAVTDVGATTTNPITIDVTGVAGPATNALLLQQNPSSANPTRLRLRNGFTNIYLDALNNTANVRLIGTNFSYLELDGVQMARLRLNSATENRLWFDGSEWNVIDMGNTGRNRLRLGSIGGAENGLIFTDISGVPVAQIFTDGRMGGTAATADTQFVTRGQVTDTLSAYLKKADTTSLSNRIDQKLNVTDTASMLVDYLLSAEAAGLYKPLSWFPEVNEVTGLQDSLSARFTKSQSDTRYLQGNQTITLSGDVLGSGTTAITTALKSTGTAGTYTKVTTDAQGRVTAGTTLSAADVPDLSGTYIPLSQKGMANGVASLGSDGKVPSGQLPVTGSLYQGTWNASTNTPTLADGVGTSGWYYRVNVAGTQNLGSGSIAFSAGDDVIYNGTIWQRVPAASAVNSVNGQTGNVVLMKGDVGLGNVDNTSDLAKPISTATQTALNLKANSAITISAGTGLTGGGNLTANRTLAVSYGTTAGTSAQGNDSRIVNAVPNTRTVTAGAGLTGGGDLTANRSFAIDPTYASFTNYYTKTNLQTSGQAAVHYSNLTNVPTSFPTSSTLQTVLTNGNTATNNITLGANGNTTPYGFNIIRSISSTNYTANFGLGAGANATLVVGNGTAGTNKIFDIAHSLAAPRYSPDGGTNYYTVWHENNHPAGTTGSITYTGAEVPSSFSFNSAGHYTASGKRNLTAADISAPITMSLGTSDFNTAYTGVGSGSQSNIGAVTGSTNGPAVGAAGAVITTKYDANYGFQIGNTAATPSALYFRTRNSGAFGSWLQFADRTWVTDNFAASGGSGNYIQAQSLVSQVGSFRISGEGRTDGWLRVQKDGSDALIPGLQLVQSDQQRWANFQLNGNVNPGLSLWITPASTSPVKRAEWFANGAASMYTSLQLTNNVAPSSGKGLELNGSTTMSWIYSYDRDGSVGLPLKIQHTGGNTYINETAGNVGIGTTSPTSKLFVNGSAQFTGKTLLGGAAGVVGSGTGTSNISYFNFYESNGTTRAGYVGKGSNGNDNTYLVSDNGSIVLGPNGFGDYILERGNLRLVNPTSNRIEFNSVGTGAPTFTTRSAGTKIALWPTVNATNVDYGLGVEASHLWLSVPQNVGSQGFKFYGGTTNIATLSATGALSVNTSVTSPTITAPSSTDLNISSPQSIMFNPGGVNRGWWDSDGLGIGMQPNSIRASLLQVGGNVWVNDAYILGSGTSPIAEFGLDGGAFIRTMGTQNLDFRRNADAHVMRISGTTGNLLINSTADNGTDKLQVNGSISSTDSKSNTYTAANSLTTGTAVGAGAGRTIVSKTTGGGHIEGQSHNGTTWVSGGLTLDATNTLHTGNATTVGATFMNGAQYVTTRVITATTTALATDHVILCNTTSGNITLNLPSATGIDGFVYRIKKSVIANTLTIDPSGAQQIISYTGPTATVFFSDNCGDITLIAQGGNWYQF